jgi:hypothetical protein
MNSKLELPIQLTPSQKLELQTAIEAPSRPSSETTFLAQRPATWKLRRLQKRKSENLLIKFNAL